MRNLGSRGSHDPNTRKRRWPWPSPRWIASLQWWWSIGSKTKHSKGATKQRSRRQSTRLRGKRRRKPKTPPPKPHRLQRHRRKQRRCGVWREHRPSLPLRDRTNPRSIEQMEEFSSRTLNYEPSPWGKPVFISYFPSNILFRASSIFKFQIWFHHCISK